MKTKLVFLGYCPRCGNDVVTDYCYRCQLVTQPRETITKRQKKSNSNRAGKRMTRHQMTRITQRLIRQKNPNLSRREIGDAATRVVAGALIVLRKVPMQGKVK